MTHPYINKNKKLFSTDQKKCEIELIKICLPHVEYAASKEVITVEKIRDIVALCLKLYNACDTPVYLDPQYFDIDKVIEALNEKHEMDKQKKTIKE